MFYFLLVSVLFGILYLLSSFNSKLVNASSSDVIFTFVLLAIANMEILYKLHRLEKKLSGMKNS